MIKITEGKRSDISTVNAFFTTPTERWGCGQMKLCDSFTCFSNDYKVGNEREFIEALDAANPGKYREYNIYWSDCN